MTRGRKKSENSKEITIQVRIDKDLNKSLESFCTTCNLNKSEAIRTILENVLK